MRERTAVPDAAIRQGIPVAVDVGHTAANPGAVSARGVGEFVFNRSMASRLAGLPAEAKGPLAPFLINADGADIALARRTEIAREGRAAALLSIHHDSVQPRYLSRWKRNGGDGHYSDLFRGYSLFYSGKHPDSSASRELAAAIGRSLRAAGFSPTLHHAEPIEGENRPLADSALGIYRFDDLVVLKTAAMPAVLVECGVIVHREEELLLADSAYQDSLAGALAAGVASFLDKFAAPAIRR